MKSVLIVDDEKVLAETIALILGRAGYIVLISTDGKQAQEIIEGKNVDLIITDLVMPRLDGLKLMEWLRDHRSLDRVKIMLMTGKPNAINPLKMHSPEADDYLVKPFDETALLGKVEKLLGKT